MTHALTAAVRSWAAANFPTWGAALLWLRAHEDRQDRPCFASVNDLLWWAFGCEVQLVKGTGVFALAGKSRDELFGSEEDRTLAKKAPLRTRDPEIDRRPSGWDGITQQAMVMGFVRRLPSAEHLYVVSKYAQGDERRAARRALRDRLLPLLDHSTRPRYVVYMLIQRYYGRVVVLDELAERVEYLFPAKDSVKRSRSFVRRLAGDVESRLKDIAKVVDEKLHAHFQQGGLVK